MVQAHTRDFSRKRLPVFFTIDDIRYDCYKALDLGQLQQFANLARGLRSLKIDETDMTPEETAFASADSAEAAVDHIAKLMKTVMKKASFSVFITKLKPTEEERESDDFEPIDHTQLIDAVKWLMEVYTARPTQPSSSSSTGSETGETGTSSTAGASLADLDQADLNLETSSTS